MEDIYLQYAKPVYQYLVTLTKSISLAEELTQETFYQAIKSLHRFKGNSSLLTWLCQIGKHLYFDYLKKEKHIDKNKDVATAENASSQPSYTLPETYVTTRDGITRIYSKIHHLSDPYKEVMLLRIGGELSFKEIGLILSQSENWARVTYYRAKTKVLEQIRKEEEQSPN
ncbi:MAG: sigma-70 family RNA polymerase sigma factor [Clostridiales bacterium]|nr:sigma-70 family RNA polymerase sigma factor [Clostridiales bacterium]